VIIKKIRKVYALIGACTLLLVWFFWPVHYFKDPYSTAILDKKGKLCGAFVAADEQWRFPPLDTVPKKFEKAIVCFEDKRFFSHIGVDPFAFIRALKLNISKKKVVSGGSTITMQVIRLSRKNKSRSFLEKMIEMVYAVRLDILKKKSTILKMYASNAPFGGNVVGLETASWRYFGVSSDKLTWAECATLAVLPNSPSLIHPGKNRELLLAKRNRLLNKMALFGVFDSTELQLALDESLPDAPYPIPMHTPHLLQKVVNDNKKQKRKRRTDRFIETTLNLGIQERLNKIVDYHHERLAANGIYNIGAIVLDVNRNEVLAYCGNVLHPVTKENYGYYVDLLPAPRSTGSILKPFLFAHMLENGELIQTQLVADYPLRFGSFAPKNYKETYDGAVAADLALGRSLNVPFVNLLYSYTTDRFYGDLKKMGLTTLNRTADTYGLTLILGGAEGSLWDIASAYAGMARIVNNYFCDTAELQSPFDKPSMLKNNQRTNVRHLTQRAQLSAGACYLTLDAMLKVIRPDDDVAWEAFASSRKVGWKTGTSFGYRDAWAVGVTPEYVVGIWVGNASGEGRPDLTGTMAAAPVLFDIYDALDKTTWFDKPEADLAKIDICAKSGFKAGVNCKEIKSIDACLGAKDADVCSYCKAIHFDKTRSFQVNSSCEPVADIITETMFVLPPSMEYFYRKRHFEYEVLPPYKSNCDESSDESRSPLTVIYPKNYSKVYIPIELSGERGRVIFEAAHRDGKKKLFWHIDNAYIGETDDIHTMPIIAESGRHVLTIVDPDGNRVERVFFVVDK
jgi:penicillin-binding protein 1C